MRSVVGNCRPAVCLRASACNFRSEVESWNSSPSDASQQVEDAESAQDKRQRHRHDRSRHQQRRRADRRHRKEDQLLDHSDDGGPDEREQQNPPPPIAKRTTARILRDHEVLTTSTSAMAPTTMTIDRNPVMAASFMITSNGMIAATAAENSGGRI